MYINNKYFIIIIIPIKYLLKVQYAKCMMNTWMKFKLHGDMYSLITDIWKISAWTIKKTLMNVSRLAFFTYHIKWKTGQWIQRISRIKRMENVFKIGYSSFKLNFAYYSFLSLILKRPPDFSLFLRYSTTTIKTNAWLGQS